MMAENIYVSIREEDLVKTFCCVCREMNL